jgi:hypothetical protein
VIDKAADFFGCELVFAVPDLPPASNYRVQVDGSVKYSGYHVEMIKAISKSFNFEWELTPVSFHSGHKKRITDYNIIESQLNIIHARPALIFMTQPFIFMNDYIAVPPGEDYDGYEKLFLPFDWQTWVWIIILFVAAFGTIFFVYFTKRNIRNFIFGRNVKTPSLNVVMIFFGISQVTLPLRNFGRFIVMMFILYCLIIRTAYQGKMFEFMTKNITKPQVESIEEMLERNYTFYLAEAFPKVFKETDFVKR